MKKAIIAVLASTLMILSFFGPILYNQRALAIAPEQASWYQEVDGVLGTDYYSLYPYKNWSLNIGFSQFGELIDSNTNVGLEYGGVRDPWAELPGLSIDNNVLPKNVWINGWLLDITYNHTAWGLRNLWIGAMFADLTAYGNPWLHVAAPGSCALESQEAFNLPGYEIRADGTINTAGGLFNGGRKTNATAITDPISVLYHGPRKFIALLVTHVYDTYEPTGATLHLVDIKFTIVFDKVAKEVTIFKEVKSIPHPKFTLTDLQVRIGSATGQGQLVSVPSGILCQLSDREEWDLGWTNVGQTSAYSSFVHFYTEGNRGESESYGLYTAYDSYFTVLPTLPANVSIPVNATYDMRVGTARWGSEPAGSDGDATYDVAQVISNDQMIVGFAAYWPSLSDWDSDAGRQNVWFRALNINDQHVTDSYISPNDEPYLAPLTVGEWDFMLSDEHRTASSITADVQFRSVAVYGVTDLNDGDDYDIFNVDSNPLHQNVIDREVYYQLNMVFNPWDLYSAFEKKDSARWVTKYDGDGETYYFYLQYSDVYPYKPYWDGWPYVYYSDFVWDTWDAYGSFAERVLVNGTLQVPGTDYILGYDQYYQMYVEFAEPPGIDARIKILFSTYVPWEGGGQYEWLAVGRDSAAVDSAGAAIVSEDMLWNWDNHLVMSGLDMQDTNFGPVTPYILSPMKPSLLPARTGYRDDSIAFNKGRIGLQDDWSCHVNADDEWLYGIPISSSNIITVGGPLANLATEYTNDFTDALFTYPGWTGTGLPQNDIFGVACWNKTVYKPLYDGTGKETVGYGVISTFRDLNGTVWLVIYGYSGQDTYYTAWSLMHSDVLAQALYPFDGLSDIHTGITTLVLQYNYTLHPTDYCFVTVKEALGTISEFNYQSWFAGFDHIEQQPQFEGTFEQPFPDWPLYPIWVTDKFPTIHVDP